MAEVAHFRRSIQVRSVCEYLVMGFGPWTTDELLTRYRVAFEKKAKAFFKNDWIRVPEANLMLMFFWEKVSCYDLVNWIEKTQYRLMNPEEVISIASVSELPQIGTVICPAEKGIFTFNTMLTPRLVSFDIEDAFSPPGTYFGVVNQI